MGAEEWGAGGLRRTLTITPPDPGASVTDLELLSFTPAHPFQMRRAAIYCQAVTNVCTVNVKVGGTTVLSAVMTVTAATEVVGAIVATLATVQGDSTEAVSIEVTTASGGTITGLVVIVEYEPIEEAA